MTSRNGNSEPWEREARSLLAPLTIQEPRVRPTLPEAIMNHAYASMSVRDIVEFSTTVLVREHLCLSIGALTSLIGLENGGRPNHD